MSLQPQYKTYNEVTVTICNDYVISNINMKGIARPGCQTHLSSLIINPPSIMQNSDTSFGTTGSVTVIDYNNEVFTRLMAFVNEETGGKFSPTEDSQSNTSNPFAPIDIKIECYTGTYSYSGSIKNWSFSFSGSVPTITLEWGVYQLVPTRAQVKEFNIEVNSLYGTFKSVDKFIEHAQNTLRQCFSEGEFIDFVYDNNGELITSGFDDYLQFPLKDDEVFGIGPDTLGKTPNMLINCYLVVANYAVSKVAKVKNDKGEDMDSFSPVYGEVVDQADHKFVVRPKYAQSNVYDSEDSKITDQLVFVQNGSQPAYSTIKVGKNNTEKTVIPMTSFRFDLDFSNAILVKDIWGNINGTHATSSDSSVSNGTVEQTANESANKSAAASKSEIEFECWNVMSFVRGNAGAKIHFLVFDENGNEHPLTAKDKGYATVMETSYELSGGVVKARVKATKVFGFEDNKVEEPLSLKGLLEASWSYLKDLADAASKK